MESNAIIKVKIDFLLLGDNGPFHHLQLLLDRADLGLNNKICKNKNILLVFMLMGRPLLC